MQEKVLCYLTRGQEILVFEQVEPAFPVIQLVKGGIDPGESPSAAAMREVLEETGLQLSDPVLLGCRLRNFRWEGRWCSVYFHYFWFQVPDDIPHAWQHTVSAGDLDQGMVFLHRFIKRAGLKLSWSFDLLFPQLEARLDSRHPLAQSSDRVLIYLMKGDHLYAFHTGNPEEGMQVPTDVIKAGETPNEAALRVLFETSGFASVALQALGCRSLVDQVWHGFVAEVPAETPDRFEHEASVTCYYSLTPKASPDLDWNLGIFLTN